VTERPCDARHLMGAGAGAGGRTPFNPLPRLTYIDMSQSGQCIVYLTVRSLSIFKGVGDVLDGFVRNKIITYGRLKQGGGGGALTVL
jgi:hypothetical protein